MTPTRISLSTGVTLDYVEQGDPGGLTVVCLHGWPDSRRSYETMLAHMPATLRVIVPSLRGFGASSSPAAGYRPKDFAEDLVQHMSRTIPTLFVSRSGARNRVGRIFIDYLRNGKGATTIAAFSARTRPGLGVSVPVTWRELNGLEGAAQWNIFNVFERLDRQRTDPWKDYAATKQTLDAALRKLRQP